MCFLAFALLSITAVIATQVIEKERTDSIFWPQYARKLKFNANCEPYSIEDRCVCSDNGNFKYCLRKTWVYVTDTDLDPHEQEILNAKDDTEYFLHNGDKCYWDRDGSTATCDFGYLLPGKDAQDSNLATYGDSPQTCEPYKTYEGDCIQCTCTSDSKTLDCTAKLCGLKYLRKATAESPVRLCEPGKFQKKECSDCKCSEDGFHASCVFKYCISKADITASGKFDNCYVGSNFMLSCQLCYCGTNGAVCEKHCRNGGKPQYNENGVLIEP